MLSLRKTVKIATSYKFAVALLGLLLISSIAEAIGLLQQNSIYNSFWFLVILIVLAIILVLCTYKRAIKEIKRRRRGNAFFRKYGKRFTYFTSLPIDNVWQIIERILLSNRWLVHSTLLKRQAGFEKGNIGIWGSILFHSSLVFIIIGIILNTSFGFHGMFALTEGETFIEGKDVFKQVIAGEFYDSSKISGVEFSLGKFEQAHRVKKTTTPASHMIVKSDGQTLNGVIHINNGMNYNGYVLHQGKWGYSPGLVVRDSTGESIVLNFVRIATQEKENSVSFKDSVLLMDNKKLQIEFFPDYRSKNSIVSLENNDLNNPVVFVKLSQYNTVLFENYLWLGQYVEQNGYHVAFPKIRYWSQFELVYDPGVTVLYVGFLFSVVGLFVRFIFTRKRISISVTKEEIGTTLVVSGWSEKFRHSFEMELKDLYNELYQAIEIEKENVFKKIYYSENQPIGESCS